MKVGFSGTRFGFGVERAVTVTMTLRARFTPGSEFHHGCCLGSDVEAAAIAMGIGYRIIAHPPIKTEWMAPEALWFADEVREQKGYFERNRCLVDETDELVATPPNSNPAVGGGTWYTVDYARKQGKPVTVLIPISEEV